MAKRLQFRRLLVLVLLLGAAFVGLGYRLMDLQWLRHKELLALAQDNTQRAFLREPRRGDILDARGNQLATSIFVKTVVANPTLIGNQQAIVARAIAPILGLNEAELAQKLQPGTNQQGNPIRGVELKHKVTVETWEKVRQTMAELRFVPDESKLPRTSRLFLSTLRKKAIDVLSEDDQLRIYPNQSLAAHVLGYVGAGESLSETTGKYGIELTLNDKLAGVCGWRVTELDRRQREVLPFREQDVEPRDGLNVVLTVDSVIQNIVENALAEANEKHSPISITGIALRPATGEILAMATLPTFDPNHLGNNPDVWRNRVIADIMEPGSTFKIVVASGALNDRRVTLRDTFHCENGAFAYGGRVLHDHDPYGLLSVEGIITKSSNIGAAKIGIKLGERRLYEYICDFGFGTKTGLPLPGEVGGIVHPPEKWSGVTIAQIPMGHGVAVTRLQMVMAMTAIANKGVLMRPMLVKQLQDRQGNVVMTYSPEPVRRVLSETAARDMITALKTVVAPGGTAPRAVLENYTVAGKTGTAQKVENGTYARGKYISSFIGFFPADDPELCISIVMDEPRNGYYGGQTAAPAFKQIAEAAASYLNIRPDKISNPSTSQDPIADSVEEETIRRVSARTLERN